MATRPAAARDTRAPKSNTRRKPPRVQDRRIARTRRELRESLVSLILERGWDAVTVRDVCEHADVGRSTFYLHYADKENLLLSGFDELQAQVSALGGAGAQPFAFAEPLFAHALENERLFAALVGRQSGQQVQWRFRDVLVTLLDAELGKVGVRAGVRPTVARFVAGGFLEHLAEALELAGQPRRAERFAARFRHLASAVVAAAERLPG